MSEDTNDMETSSTKMDSAEFEAKLREFFTKHKQSKVDLASRIAFEFKGHEDVVLEHLHNKYVLGMAAERPTKKTTFKLEEHADTIGNTDAPATEKSKKKNGKKSDEHSDSHKNSEATAVIKPKSKKKPVIIIIILVAVLGGLGVTGFMMKDKIMGKGHGTEKEATKEKAGSESKVVAKKDKKAMTPQQVEAALDSMDKTKSVPKDSTVKK